MQVQLQQYKILPISLEHHSYSLNSQGPHQACIPSPCKGNGHLGMRKITAKKQKQKISHLMSQLSLIFCLSANQRPFCLS
uniref:Uncharacterized protein n=1 Tax=Zosterops lateralis melanops TaxID=1220523 RepID=A0A8D2PYC7_ZOSLA